MRARGSRVLDEPNALRSDAVRRTGLSGEEARLQATIGQIGQFIANARRVLTRSTVNRFVRARWPYIAVGAGAGALLRPLVWRLRDVSPWMAPARAAIFAGAAAVVAVGVLAYVAWRKRPSALAAARHLDGALGLAEVVASGFAFERDGREDEMAVRAREQGAAALAGVAIDRLCVAPPVAPMRRRVRRLAALALTVGLVVGAFDVALADRIVHPITEDEIAAARELAETAEAMREMAARDPANAKNKTVESLINAAEQAAAAAQRGDRRRALDALDELRDAARALEAQERAKQAALRAVRDALDPSGSGGDGERATATAAEAMKKMLKELTQEKGEAAMKELAKRLAQAEARAEAAAAREGGKDARMERLAASLREAKEGAERNDPDAVKRAIERAEREASGLSKPGEASSERTLSRIGDRASDLGKSVREGSRPGNQRGKDGKGNEKGDGEGKGDKGKDGNGKNAHGKDGKGDGKGKSPNGDPTGSPGQDDPSATGDRKPGPEGKRVKISGNSEARTDVREGERAISAIQGMGRGDDPRAYKDIFPSYDSAVEDGLRDELVPAARRGTVRRYFSAIRPEDTSESSNRKTEQP